MIMRNVKYIHVILSGVLIGYKTGYYNINRVAELMLQIQSILF